MSAQAGGSLHVVATPLGNLGDLSRRAIEVLTAVGLVAAEDTRATRGLLEAFAIKTRLVSLHEHNEERRLPELLRHLRAGQDLALVSDAGTPGVSDPGARLVAAVRAAGLNVRAVPGPSAVTAALSVSGFNADRYVFAGFPPPKGAARRALLARAATEPWSVVLFEAPHRVRRSVAELAELAPDRPALVARELTKLHEETRQASLSELSAWLGEREPRGESTLVLGPVAAAPPALDLDRAVEDARSRLRAGQSRSEAARDASRGVKGLRRQVYRALGAAAGEGEE